MSKIATSIKCESCGKFIAYTDLDRSHYHFIPLNEFGPEEEGWTCPRCLEKDRA